MLALLIATAAVAQSDGPFVAGLIGWQDLGLVVIGLLLLLIGSHIVRRRWRRADELEANLPLIDAPTPALPGQPSRSAWPPPDLLTPPPAYQNAPRRAAALEDHGEEVQAGVVRFHRPPDGTLQLLPGRLVIVSGKEGVDEIRFVRVPGTEPVVTFGRSPGEPHTHIELQSPTVSRRHAAMRFERGAWHISNLSTTNPVVVRGRPLSVNEAPVRLEDGDHVEMGEVTFRFHGPPAPRAAAPESAIVKAPEPAVVKAPEPAVAKAPEPAVAKAPEPAAAKAPEPAVAKAPEPAVAKAPEPAVAQAPEPAVVEAPEPAVAKAPEPAVVTAPEPAIATPRFEPDRLRETADDGAVAVAAPPRTWARPAPRRPGRPVVRRVDGLSEREIEIVRHAVEGKSNREIGALLDISARTVSTHLTHIFRKLNVATRRELADHVRRNGVG